MRSWKRRTRAQHRARLSAWYQSEAKHQYKGRHESKYVLSQIRKGSENWSKTDRGHAAWEAWWSPIWRKKEFLKYKRQEAHVKHGLAMFSKYPYYEDCSYHVCKPTEITADRPAFGRIDVEGTSLLTGGYSSCSYEHCGIRHLTKEDGEERVAFAQEHGMLPYELKYVYATEGMTQEQHTNAIRASIKQDEEWQFNKNKGTDRCTEKGREWILRTFGVDISTLTPMTDEELQSLYP